MDPWRVLEIEATQDSRAIKRAYARHLKTARPDEKPEAFQQLHAAYKQALALAERGQRQSAPAIPEEFTSDQGEMSQATQDIVPDQTQVSLTFSTSEPEREPVAQDPEEARSEEPPFRDQPPPPPRDADPVVWAMPPDSDDALAASEEHERLLARCERLLDSGPARDDATAWHFLATSPRMLDSDFHHGLGDALLTRLLERQREADAPLLPPPVLIYLNSLFDWEGRRSLLVARFGDTALDRLLSPLDAGEHGDEALVGALRGGKQVVRREASREAREPEPTSEEHRFAGMGLRIFAFLVDLFVVEALLVMPVGVVRVMVADFSGSGGVFGVSEFAITSLMLAPPAYLLMALVMESGRAQATPGKRMLGLRVTNRKFARVPLLQGLWRATAFLLVYTLLSKVAVLVNVFLGGHLLHDRVSGTYVLQGQRRRKE